MKSIQGKIDQVLLFSLFHFSADSFSVERLIVNERKVRHEELAMTSDLLVQDLQDKIKYLGMNSLLAF